MSKRSLILSVVLCISGFAICNVVQHDVSRYLDQRDAQAKELLEYHTIDLELRVIELRGRTPGGDGSDFRAPT